MGKIVGKLITWFMIMVSVVIIFGCGAKKTQIKKELKASEVVREEAKTIKEQKEVKETSVKKEHLFSLSEDMDMKADEIIIQEGSKTTTIKKPVLSKKKSESNKTVVEESNIDTTEEKQAVIKSFERINEVVKSTEKQKERKQFDWGLLLLQMLPVIVVIYIVFIAWKYIKNKKPL
ncbi:hypothetical protein [Paenimyroides ceti]